MKKKKRPTTTTRTQAGKGRGSSASPVARPILREDLARFADGTHARLYETMGAHRTTIDGKLGVRFAVWAPAASRVSVVGGFNDWDPSRHPLGALEQSGIWAGFIPGIERGALYKFHIASRIGGYSVNKADPFAFRGETPSETASVVWDLDYEWKDDEWMAGRRGRDYGDRPVSIYEMHLGSWRRSESDSSRLPTYREIADDLVPYLERMGFTHVEFLPPKEHPFYGSWGYQTTSYFAPTSRYGSPQDLMHLIDRLHRNGIGVILDWVPSHFPTDEHGIGFFDGTHLFEHADPRQGYHPDWKSSIFNYGREQVCSFLISSARFWLDRYHIDGLRVDAVASMLYRDYSREQGEWIPNQFGGRENLEAIAFLRRLNDELHSGFPGALTIAEESTTWPMVSRPTYIGGLGFDMKWDMGWMHDTLEYMNLDPIHRKFHHDKLTFRMVYAFSEKFVLPLSHDEVVHGKGSLIGKMAGDEWQKFANLRALYGYMYAQPGKKLLFMGAELGQWREWDHERGLDWDLLRYPLHSGLQLWVENLNRTYRDEIALHGMDFDPRGFRWIDCGDADQSVISFLRRTEEGREKILVICNFTPIPRHNYRVGVPDGGRWIELLNSDAECYAGGDLGNLGHLDSVPMRYHDLPHSLVITLPPLSAIFLKHEEPRE